MFLSLPSFYVVFTVLAVSTVAYVYVNYINLWLSFYSAISPEYVVLFRFSVLVSCLDSYLFPMEESVEFDDLFSLSFNNVRSYNLEISKVRCKQFSIYVFRKKI
jgi:hypothetical protein